MASKGRAVGALIKYGPIVYTAAQRYGPGVVDQLRAQGGPAERLVTSRVTRGNQRRKALAHAGTVIDGSVLQVFHRSEPHWVVFSGEEPVGVHPPTTAPYAQLLDRADLGNRLRPEDAHRTVRLPRRRRRPPGPDRGQRPTA